AMCFAERSGFGLNALLGPRPPHTPIRILVHLSREGDPASRIRSNDDPVTSPQREMAGRDCGNSGRSRTLENLDLLDLHQEFGGGERPAVGAREGWNCCPF